MKNSTKAKKVSNDKSGDSFEKYNVRLWINVIRKNINKAVSFSL